MIAVQGRRIVPVVNYKNWQGIGSQVAKQGIDLANNPNAALYLPGYPGIGATIYDRSGSSPLNHGTITGATWERLPSGLWVLNFDGDDYVNCGANVPQITTGYIRCWFKPLIVGVGATNSFIMGMPCRNVGWTSPWIGFQMGQPAHAADSSKIYWYGAIGGLYKTFLSATGRLVQGVYKRLMATWDGTTARIWVNGVNTDSDATLGVGNITYGTSPKFVIGVRSVDSLGEYTKGGIALEEAGITIPTAAQAMADYQQTRQLFGV